VSPCDLPFVIGVGAALLGAGAILLVIAKKLWEEL
jgi:hypothetical protein